jgi:hypothetical protein
MAAYNAGEGRIGRALTAQNTRDYYQMDLPRETERYVYRIAAIKAVMENSAGYGLDMPYPQSRYRAPEYVERRVDCENDTPWPQLAEKAGCDYKALRLLNPHILTDTLNGSYVMRFPAENSRNLAE